MINKIYLLDSNILIYAEKQENKLLQNFIFENQCYVSELSSLECLGYTKITDLENTFFNNCFLVFSNIAISGAVIGKTMQLRQYKKSSVGDAIIAATALLYHTVLLTVNVKDFEFIDGLEVENPFDKMELTSE